MSKIILGIDASRSCSKNATGVEKYSTEIIKNIIENNKDFELRLYSPKKIYSFPIALQKIIKFPRLWTLLRLSIEMLFNKPDILYVPSHVLPFFAPTSCFTMIHDLSFKKFPKVYSVKNRLYLDFGVKMAIKSAFKIFVPTEAVKKDLLRYYECKPDKIKVIHHGSLRLKTDNISLRDGVGKNSQRLFIFYLGRLEEKKNISVLLEAFKIVKKKLPNLKLVLGGLNSGGYDIGDKDIEVTGYLSEEDVAYYFSKAEAFILPSLDEGFGMPVLQAFSVDCPVICSDIDALREVAGDAALFANPNNPEEFANKIIEITINEKLKKELIKKGRNRLTDFSWDKAAQELLSEFTKTI